MKPIRYEKRRRKQYHHTGTSFLENDENALVEINLFHRTNAQKLRRVPKITVKCNPISIGSKKGVKLYQRAIQRKTNPRM